MKKVISTFLLIIYFALPLKISAQTLEGHAERINIEEQLHNELFTGQIEHLETKNTINMTVSQVLDGNFSLEGDEFFAEIVNDVEGDNGVLLPKGTIAHGLIRQTSEAKRLGRNGYINLEFDYLITPDGREIPINGRMSTKLHPIVEVSKIVATDLGYTTIGGIAGGMIALNTLGIEAAIASNGYTLAGGAAIGGTIGLGMALYRKGKDVLISPGDEIKVKLTGSIPLPVYKKEALMQHELICPGLTVKITNILYEKDPFGELNTITLSLTIANMTKMTFSSLNMALINDYNVIFYPSVFGDSKLMFTQIKPGDRVAGRLSFSVDNIKRKYWLIFYDKRTQKPVAKLSIDNAYKNVSDKTKKRNEKATSKKNKNFYKDENDSMLFN